MKSMLTPVAIALAMLGWSATLPAQSLGPARAKAWLGRPLDMIVPVRLDEAQARDDCVHAVVRYGDHTVPAGQVSVQYQVVGDVGRVRVRADVPVDEPVVDVAVRVGCGSTMTRRYTVLADLAPEESWQASSAVAQGATPAGLLAAGTMAPRVGAASSRTPVTPRTDTAPRAGSTARTDPTPRPATVVANAEARQLPRSRAAVAAAAPVAGLTPVLARRHAASTMPRVAEAVGEVPATQADGAWRLRLTSTLVTPQDTSRRAVAAMMWRILNADPDELLQTSRQLELAQAELAQLRAVPLAARPAAPTAVVGAGPAAEKPAAAPSTAAEVAVPADAAPPAERPSLTESVREVLSFVPWQSWAAALATFFAIMGVTAWRRRRVKPAAAAPSAFALDSRVPVDPWDRHQSRAPESAAIAEPVTLPSLPEAPPIRETVQPAPAFVASVQPGAVPVLADAVRPGPRAARKAAPATPPALRMESLVSTLQEAQFLASVGLRQDALHVLRAYIRDSVQPAPVAFYELMILSANSEDNRKSLPGVRRRFHEVYGVPAPSLDDLEAPAGADAHAPLMQKIADAWPSLRVLDIIQRRVFDRPESSESLSIHAWRDLLWLHDIAREVLATMGITPDVEAAADESLAPWADPDSEFPDSVQPPGHDDVTDQDRFAIDLDLAADPSRAEVMDGQPALHPRPLRGEEEALAAITAEPALALAPLEWDGAPPRGR